MQLQPEQAIWSELVDGLLVNWLAALLKTLSVARLLLIDLAPSPDRHPLRILQSHRPPPSPATPPVLLPL